MLSRSSGWRLLWSAPKQLWPGACSPHSDRPRRARWSPPRMSTSAAGDRLGGHCEYKGGVDGTVVAQAIMSWHPLASYALHRYQRPTHSRTHGAPPPDAAHHAVLVARRARGGRHQPPPELAAAGGMGGEEPRRRTSLSALCRLSPCSTPPAVGGPPARSSPSPRKVRNRPLPTRDSHGRKMPRRRRADPPRAPPTARSQSGLCCRVGWGTPHPTPTCRWEGTPWVPCAGAGPSAGRVGPSGATSSASLAVATPRHPDGGSGSLGDTAASSEHGAWMHRRDENFACRPRDRIKSQMTMPLQGPVEGPATLPPFSSRFEDGADHEMVSSESVARAKEVT